MRSNSPGWRFANTLGRMGPCGGVWVGLFKGNGGGEGWTKGVGACMHALLSSKHTDPRTPKHTFQTDKIALRSMRLPVVDELEGDQVAQALAPDLRLRQRLLLLGQRDAHHLAPGSLVCLGP